ncbi:MAG: hypothetical protein KIT80_17795 [Chitinophagaceae bacterium]|nr:hypothetical protein [Chitinophagaceae bacterium]MCW5928778.1 hypothetical protein [Chitinophagaceae bacterium]
MTTLRIEHKISNYNGWKMAFDSDPINRKKSGVNRYRIYRPMDNPDFVIIELDFDNIEQAQATQTSLKQIFPNIEGKLIFDIKLKILNIIEETIL